MKILVVGGLGSIGSRYVAILKYLGHEPIIIDPADGRTMKEPNDYGKAIIATPTHSHYDICLYFIDKNKPLLCEKPLSKDLKECEELRGYLDGYVVCNYKYALEGHVPTKYNYYKTGSDGVAWDCCQLIYLNPEIEIKTTSPIWTLKCGVGNYLDYVKLEASYVNMIKDFVEGNYANLWSMEDGYKMTKAVLDRIGK